MFVNRLYFVFTSRLSDCGSVYRSNRIYTTAGDNCNILGVGSWILWPKCYWLRRQSFRYRSTIRRYSYGPH